jgi:hypothetical protein
MDAPLVFAEPTPIPTLAELLAWLAEPVPDPLGADATLEHFLLMDARVRFLKTLPHGSVVLDLGAGEGQLRNFREWLGFPRRDLRFVGVSLEHGAHTRAYEEFFVGDVEAQKPRFGLTPNAVIAGQFIEHTREPRAIADWLAGLLAPGSLLHFDWPSPHAAKLPARAGILAAGYDVSTLNFFDDATHVRTFSIPEMAAILGAAGFAPREAGIPRLPYLSNQLKHHGIARRDQYLLTMALWLRTGFVSYLQAERCAP